MIIHLKKTITDADVKSKSLGIELGNMFEEFRMQSELNKLQKGSKTSLIVTTANAELFKDLIHLPLVIGMLITPHRLIQWGMHNISFKYSADIKKMKEDEDKKRKAVIHLFMEGITDILSLFCLLLIIVTLIRLPHLLIII